MRTPTFIHSATGGPGDTVAPQGDTRECIGSTASAPCGEPAGRHDPEADYLSLIADYAVGAVTPAEALLVRTHAQMRPASGAMLAIGDLIGGALLEEIDPVDMSASCLTSGKPRRRRRPMGLPCQAQIDLAMTRPEALRWGWLAPGIHRHRLPTPDSYLLRVASGRSAPSHDHVGRELTLVLRGELVDDAGAHGAGEIVFAGPGDRHAPRAGDHEACVCLVAMSGTWRLSDWTHRLAARLLAS